MKTQSSKEIARKRIEWKNLLQTLEGRCPKGKPLEFDYKKELLKFGIESANFYISAYRAIPKEIRKECIDVGAIGVVELKLNLQVPSSIERVKAIVSVLEKHGAWDIDLFKQHKTSEIKQLFTLLGFSSPLEPQKTPKEIAFEETNRSNADKIIFDACEHLLESVQSLMEKLSPKKQEELREILVDMLKK